eukprot:7559908-Heterocapsa_arctica.AAC.1
MEDAVRQGLIPASFDYDAAAREAARFLEVVERSSGVLAIAVRILAERLSFYTTSELESQY